MAKRKPKRPVYNTNREYENLVNEVRCELGYTFPALAKRVGCSSGHLWSVSQGYVSPLYQHGRLAGTIKPWAKRLCEVLETDIAVLFPREVCDFRRAVLSDEEVGQLLLGDYTKRKSDRDPVDTIYLKSLLDCLVKKDRKAAFCLAQHEWFGEFYEQIGKMLGGKTRSWAGILLQRAYRLLHTQHTINERRCEYEQEFVSRRESLAIDIHN